MPQVVPSLDSAARLSPLNTIDLTQETVVTVTLAIFPIPVNTAAICTSLEAVVYTSAILM
jgi:hypothetical protein